jgi:hypothetical protein
VFLVPLLEPHQEPCPELGLNCARTSNFAPQRKLVERAKQMTEEDSADRSSQKEALQQEFEQLLNIFFTGKRSRGSSSSMQWRTY